MESSSSVLACDTTSTAWLARSPSAAASSAASAGGLRPAARLPHVCSGALLCRHLLGALVGSGDAAIAGQQWQAPSNLENKC